MTKYTWLGLAAAGVFVVGLLLWLNRSDERAADAAALPEQAAVPETAPVDVVPSAPVAEARTDIAPEAEGAAAAVSVPPDTTVNTPRGAQRLQARVDVRFVDANGAPWPGVSFSTNKDPGSPTTSDSSGRAELEVSEVAWGNEWQAEFVARREGCATRVLRCTLAVGRITHLGDVVLGPGVRILGRVLDPGGRGLAEIEVGLSAPQFEIEEEGQVRRHGSQAFERAATVRSQADGAFVLDGAAPGEWRVWARGEGTRYGWSEPFTLLEGQDLRGVEVVVAGLAEQDVITGVVVEPDGTPIGHARLSYSYSFGNMSGSTSTQAGDDGRFRILVDYDVVYDIGAGDPQGRYSDAMLRGVQPGARDVELRLIEKTAFDLRVRGPEGEAIEGCTFTFMRGVREGHWVGNAEEPEVAAPGRYRFTTPTMRFRIEVTAKGYAKKSTLELDPPAPGAEIELALERARYVRGRVMAGGKPAVGARVELRNAIGEQSVTFNGFECLYEAWSPQETVCSGDGSFELPYDEDQSVWVRAELAGWAAADTGPLVPSRAGILELVLTQGGAIEGVVLLPAGADAEGTIVGINRGDGAPRTLRAGAGGRFRFDGLTPGNWQVLRRDEELDPNRSSTSTSLGPTDIEWSCVVSEGRTTRFDLDLTR